VHLNPSCAGFWLNLGSKAEVNELFKEWKAAHAKIDSVPRRMISWLETTKSRGPE
jgi:hypothetical protein